MTDPHRLLSSISDADDLERELLASIQAVHTPKGAKSEVWSKLSAQILAAGVLGTAHGSAAASGALGAPAASSGGGALVGGASPILKVVSSKLVLGLAVAGFTLSGTAIWLHHPSSSARPAVIPSSLAATSSVARAAGSAVPSSAAPADLPPAPALTASAPSSPSPRSGVQRSSADRLSAESALLTQARAELRRGDAAAAQKTLDQLRAQFPKGVLAQEREVLSIEVLAARGNPQAARNRAQAFIAAYPKSPHSAQLRRFAEAP
jgi:hypothetical protein